MRRAAIIGLTVLTGAALLYVSRFWFVSLWPRNAVLPPQGGLLAGWLRGTPLAPFEALIWAAGAFVVLTGVQKLADRIDRD